MAKTYVGKSVNNIPFDENGNVDTVGGGNSTSVRSIKIPESSVRGMPGKDFNNQLVDYINSLADEDRTITSSDTKLNIVVIPDEWEVKLFNDNKSFIISNLDIENALVNGYSGFNISLTAGVPFDTEVFLNYPVAISVTNLDTDEVFSNSGDEETKDFYDQEYDLNLSNYIYELVDLSAGIFTLTLDNLLLIKEPSKIIQDNFVRNLYIDTSSLSGIGSMEEQICEYILNLPPSSRTIMDTDSKWNIVLVSSGGSGE